METAHTIIHVRAWVVRSDGFINLRFQTVSRMSVTVHDACVGSMSTAISVLSTGKKLHAQTKTSVSSKIIFTESQPSLSTIFCNRLLETFR